MCNDQAEGSNNGFTLRDIRPQLEPPAGSGEREHTHVAVNTAEHCNCESNQ